MDTTPCPKCGRGNPPGARFCTGCGAGMEAQAACPSCRTLQASGNQFCLSCGTAIPNASWSAPAADGAVVEGVWQRTGDEFVRRVDPEDARTFLGSRVVRVPQGSVGVVVVDGAVERVLPPGQQTSVTLFERIRDFFTGRERTAFFLVDLRPIPIPFQLKVQAGGREVQAQALVSFSLQRGNKDGIGTFLTRLMGDRPGFAAQDLHNLLRPDVVRLATAALDRVARRESWTWNDAEGEIRRALAEQLGPKYGLGIEVSVAPPTAVASLDVHLGAVALPATRACEKCEAQLPASTRFCDRCGHRQGPLLSNVRPCPKCGSGVPDAHRFCESCGTQVPENTGVPALFTSDGEQVELDLVVRAQGRHEDFDAAKVTPALAGVAAAHLRGTTLAELVSADGFGALEEALKRGAQTALLAAGLQVSAISIVDVRSANGQWMLGARAELKRAKAEAQLGREWVAQAAQELDLQQLTWAQALHRAKAEREFKLGQLHVELAAGRREVVIRSDDAFSRDSDELADRQRRETLADGSAALDRAQAQRNAARDVAVADAQRTVARANAAAGREDELTGLAHDMKREDLAFDHESQLTRRAIALDSEKQRLRAQDEAFAATMRQDVAYTDHERRAKLEQALKDSEELRQIEKLRAMAELDRQSAAQENEHEFRMREALKGLSEKEILALQATALSKAEGGGAAWAQALSSADAAKALEARLTDAEKHAAQLQGVMKDQLDRLTQMTTAAVQAGGGAEVFGRSLDAVSRVAAAKAQAPAVVVAGPCGACGASLRPEAKFCAACGAAQ